MSIFFNALPNKTVQNQHSDQSICAWVQGKGWDMCRGKTAQNTQVNAQNTRANTIYSTWENMLKRQKTFMRIIVGWGWQWRSRWVLLGRIMNCRAQGHSGSQEWSLGGHKCSLWLRFLSCHAHKMSEQDTTHKEPWWWAWCWRADTRCIKVHFRANKNTQI